MTHPKQHPQVEFHIAQIFIDDELQLPVRYAAYIWPKAPGAEPEVLEEYTYQDLKINVGLTDDDFNINNQATTSLVNRPFEQSSPRMNEAASGFAGCFFLFHLPMKGGENIGMRKP